MIGQETATAGRGRHWKLYSIRRRAPPAAWPRSWGAAARQGGDVIRPQRQRGADFVRVRRPIVGASVAAFVPALMIQDCLDYMRRDAKVGQSTHGLMRTGWTGDRENPLLGHAPSSARF